MSGGSQYRVTVPALDGGVNLKDAPNLVEDNQLTDVLNMWWKDQALRTRPGLTTDEGKCVDIGPRRESISSGVAYPYVQRDADYFNYDLYMDGKRVVTIIDNHSLVQSETVTKDSAVINRCNEDGEFSKLMEIPTEEAPENRNQEAVSQAVKFNEHWYAYTGSGAIFFSMYLQEDSSVDSDQSDFIMEAYPHTPLVAVNGKGIESDTLKGSFSFSGTMYEGYNALTDIYHSTNFKVMYTTDGKATVFPLPAQLLSNEPGEYIGVSFTDKDGNNTLFDIP